MGLPPSNEPARPPVGPASVSRRATGWVGIEQLMTAGDVADVLRCSIRTVGELRRRGDLAALLIGNAYVFEPETVRSFIADRRDAGQVAQEAA